jgi:hypothetical protein
MRRLWAWLAYHTVIWWPVAVPRQTGIGRIWWALLPWAGRHAYSDRPDVQQ